MPENKFENRKLILDIRSLADKSVFSEIFKLREYRQADSIIRNAKFPILDVGAHLGFFSLYCSCLNSDALVYALEPEKNNYRRLVKHLKINKCNNVQSFNLALATNSLIRELVVSTDSHNNYLKTNELKNKLTIQDTETASLSDFCENNDITKISLIKMDIEGAEFEIFRNWDKALEKVQTIIMEYHDNAENNHAELVSILEKNNFTVEQSISKFDKNLGLIYAVNKKF